MREQQKMQQLFIQFMYGSSYMFQHYVYIAIGERS
jgi:hypothetical protein